MKVMRHGLRNSGKGIIIFILLAASVFPASAGELETDITPERIRVGEVATLRVRIPDDGSVKIGEIPNVEGMEISYSGTQRTFEFINGKTWSGMIITLALVPSRAGTFTIPPVEFTVNNEKYRSRPKRLLVSGAETGRAAGRRNIIPQVTVSRSTIYVGEPVILRYYILHSSVDMGRKPVVERLPDARGFVRKQVEEIIGDTIVKSRNGEYVKTHVATFVLIPAEKGRFSPGGGSVALDIVDNSLFFSFPRRISIKFGTVPVRVRQLPNGAMPRNYRGDVGRFTLEADLEKTEVEVFQEMRMRIVLRGTGNIVSVSEPRVETARGVRVLMSKGKEHLRISGNDLEGEKEYILSLIPERSGRLAVKSISLEYFNPSSGTYRQARAGPFQINALEHSPNDARKSVTKTVKGNKPKVDIPLIALLLGCIAALIAGVAVWEKMRLPNSKVRSEKNGDTDIRTRVDTGPDFRRELYLAMKRDDHNRFLRVAERALMEAGKGIDKKGDFNPEEYIRLKDKIYVYKYGGGNIDSRGIKELFEEIISVLGL